MESKYDKVLASNLGALKLFITTVPLEGQESLYDNYRQILADPKFWKLAKHKASTVIKQPNKILNQPTATLYLG